MWTCRNCNARFAFDEVEPQIDEEAFFFICSVCDYRNKLVNIGRDAAGQMQLVQRDDDTEEALAVRLREYHEKTNPVLDLFRRKEYVITVDARPSKEAVQQDIRTRLGLPPMKTDTPRASVPGRM